MKYLHLLFVILIIPLLASRCLECGVVSVKLKNNSGSGIVGISACSRTGFSYPDTLLPEIPGFDINFAYIKTPPKTGQVVFDGECSFTRALEDYTSSDTLSVFIFDTDTLLNLAWEEIRGGYKILARYDLSADDLDSLGGVLYYPPTESMKNVHMYPPYDAIIGNNVPEH